MKKLIAAIFIASSVSMLQAATAKWYGSASNIYDGTGSTASTAKYSGSSIYVFDNAKASQTSLYASIVTAGTSFDATKVTGYAGTISANNGVLLTTSTFSYGETSASSSELSTYSFYFVIIDDDKAYFSNIASASANNSDQTAKAVSFLSQRNGSIAAPTTAGEYAGAGAWSSTASIPEPTSAMLLMLGLCGLALKRKNA